MLSLSKELDIFLALSREELFEISEGSFLN
jgi:hypothetical protein